MAEAQLHQSAGRRVAEALGPRACVGVPGGDDERLDPVVLEVQLVDDHAGALHLVGGEHPSGVAHAVAGDDGEVLSLVAGNGAGAGGEGLDAAAGDARQPAFGSGQAARNRLRPRRPYGHW